MINQIPPVILFMHVTWQENPERLRHYPPASLSGADKDYAHQGREPRQARAFDFYRDIRHAAVMTLEQDRKRTTAKHWLIGPEAGVSSVDTLLRAEGRPRESTVFTVQHESDIIRGLAAEINATMGVSGVIGGWNLRHGVWPLVVGKSMQHGATLDSRCLADPTRDFNHPPLFQVETMYTQGVYFKARPLPALSDVMQWWGLQADNALPDISQEELSTLSPENMLAVGVPAVDKYLNGMAELVMIYTQDVGGEYDPRGYTDLRGPRKTGSHGV